MSLRIHCSTYLHPFDPICLLHKRFPIKLDLSLPVLFSVDWSKTDRMYKVSSLFSFPAVTLNTGTWDCQPERNHSLFSTTDLPVRNDLKCDPYVCVDAPLNNNSLVQIPYHHVTEDIQDICVTDRQGQINVMAATRMLLPFRDGYELEKCDSICGSLHPWFANYEPSRTFWC